MSIKFKYLTISLLLLILITSSCRNLERLFVGDTMGDMNEDKLVDLILEHDISYESLYFRRLLIEVDMEGQSRSFRANMYIKKDSAIIISVVPIMGIELFRVMLDKSSIVVLDRLNRKTYVGGYQTISSRFMIDVDYNVLQSILTNSLFAYPSDDSKKVKRYYGSNLNSFYSLKSVDDKGFERRRDRNQNFILHQLDIKPDIYRIFSTIISQPQSSLNLHVEYDNFAKIDRDVVFPGVVKITGSRGSEKVEAILNYSNVDINGSNSLSFSVPSNYENVTF